MHSPKRYLKLFPPLYLIFIGYGLYYISNQFPNLILMNDLLIIFGWILIGIGFMLDFSSIVLFIKSKTSLNPHGEAKRLVTKGFYKFTRNPMYLGLVFLLFGWGLKNGFVLTPIAAVLLVFILTYLFIKPEERLLSEKFPLEFPEYTKSVRRWI
jgi:protein-S-isoprenylcysteine O-methyltransferase Ste14